MVIFLDDHEILMLAFPKIVFIRYCYLSVHSSVVEYKSCFTCNVFLHQGTSRRGLGHGRGTSRFFCYHMSLLTSSYPPDSSIYSFLYTVSPFLEWTVYLIPTNLLHYSDTFCHSVLGHSPLPTSQFTSLALSSIPNLSYVPSFMSNLVTPEVAL